MNQETQTPHKRRVRYKGKYPKKFEEKYKELQPEKYQDTIDHVISKGNTPAGMHISICVNEILDFFDIQPGQQGLDATLGYGGHTSKMLEKLQGEGHIYGLDVDPIESAKTKKRLEEKGFGPDILTVKLENFANIDFANYVSLKDADGNEVSAVKTYENGVVTVNPSENLAAKAKYSITIDKDALSKLACEYTGSDFSFTTLGENEYLNDTLTTTDASGWVGNAYADFPSSHWAGGDAACIKYKQASGQTEISPYSIQKDLLNPIDLTEDKVMIEADLLADTTNGLKINFNINKDENTTDDDALFRISGEGSVGSVSVRGNNGNLSKAYNPDMTVGATDNGRPTYSFTEKINVKALLSYSENNIKYYVTFAKDGVTRVYTRDGWNDQNNMTLSTGLPTEIRNVAFTASGANSKFWVENVKITKASQVSATVSNCDVNSVSIAFEGEKGDYSKYVDLYDAQNNAVEAEKVYNEETNEVEFKNVTLSAGNIYYVKIANVLLLSETECFYDGGTSKRFIPTNVGYQLTKIDSNKGTGAYFSADIKNCNAADKKVMAVIAEKDASGALKNASVQEIDVAAGATEEIYVNFLNIGSDSTVEAYVWEKAAVKPIISKITVVHR